MYIFQQDELTTPPKICVSDPMYEPSTNMNQGVQLNQRTLNNAYRHVAQVEQWQYTKVEEWLFAVVRYSYLTTRGG